jgi:Glycosyltransferase like family
MTELTLTFVVAANCRDILDKNLLASPCLKADAAHQVIVQQGFHSAATAYNSGLEQSRNEIVVFVHQDVFLPEDWVPSVAAALQTLEAIDPGWGVVGCWGVRSDRAKFGHLYTPGDGVIGGPVHRPERVQTLDEVVLILRKSSGLKFDERLPGFHFYGTDICLTAAHHGMSCYAISAFCVHNSRQYFEYPPDFSQSYRIVKSKWKQHLPIQTSCIRVSRFDWDLQKRWIKGMVVRATGRSRQRGPRLEDPRLILRRT